MASPRREPSRSRVGSGGTGTVGPPSVTRHTFGPGRVSPVRDADGGGQARASVAPGEGGPRHRRATPPAHPNPVLSVEGLRKRYGPVTALLDFSFQAFPGEIVGILGPNGAGKTTVMEILAGLRHADAGRAIVLGADARRLPPGVRDRIGLATQRAALPRLLTVQEVLRLHRALRTRPCATAPLLARVGLDERRTSRVGRLSGGQLQRLTIAIAVSGNPELLLLDEPTAELDPQARRTVWDLIR